MQFQLCGGKSLVLRSQIEFTQRHLTEVCDYQTLIYGEAYCCRSRLCDLITYLLIYFPFLELLVSLWFKVLLIYKVCLRPGPSNIFLISFLYTILLNFVAQLFPFSNIITEIYFWSTDCCLKSIQQCLSHNTWHKQFYKQ